jgi:hypothetical protein
MKTKKPKMERDEIIAAIRNLLESQPRRQLEQALDPAVVLIQSEASSCNSSPPDLEFVCSDELSLLEIRPYGYREKSRSPGAFCYQWEAVTTNAGLFMDAGGRFYAARLTGSGEFASFPAHPGDTGVSINIEYHPQEYDLDALTSEELGDLLARFKQQLKQSQKHPEL